MKLNLVGTARLLFVSAAWATLPLAAPLHGASPGFPFAEDFQSQSLLDSTQTTARWTSSGVTLGRARHLQLRNLDLAPRNSRIGNSQSTDAINDIAVRDMDGDGNMDVITAGAGGVFVYYVDDDDKDNLESIEPVRITPEMSFRTMSIGDFDRDGWLDVAAAGDFRAVLLFINDEGKRSVFMERNRRVSNLRVIALASEDMDGDGALDLVLLQRKSSSVEVHLNDGVGNFSLRENAVSTTSGDNKALGIGDFNGDRRMDIVLAKTGRVNVFHLGDGSGGFGEARLLSPPATGVDYRDIAVGDVNSDGHLDIVVGVRRGQNILYLGDGNAGFSTGSRISNSASWTLDVELADLDGDGDLDLVEGVSREGHRIYLNQDGVLDLEGLPIRGRTSAIAVGDVDGDGYLGFVRGRNTAWLEVARLPERQMSTPSTSLFDTGRGRVVSGKVNGDVRVPRAVFLTATAVQQRHTEIEYYLSNDDGKRWIRAYPGKVARFSSAGNVLRWRAELKSRSPVRTTTLTRVGIEDVLQVSIDGNAFRDGGLYTATSQTTREASTPVTITLLNPGDRPSTITRIEPVGEGFVLQGEDGKPLSGDIGIEGGGSHQDIRLVFKPTRRGIHASTLTISGNDGGRALPEIRIGLRGRGLAPEINVRPNEDPVRVRVGTSDSQVVKIRNKGEESLSISTPTITNPEFSLVNPAAFPVTATAGGLVEIGFWFEPEGRGDIATTITLSSNAINGPQPVLLRGKGVAPVISVERPGEDDSIERIDFKQVTATHISTLRHVIKNTGDWPLIVTSVTVQNPWFEVIEPTFGGAFGPFREVLVGSTLALVVQFEPQGRATTNDALFIHSDALNNDEVSPVPVEGVGIAAEMVIHVTEARVTVADTANQMIDSGDSYHFGDVAVNTTASARVFVSNQRGDALLRITPRLDGAGSFRWKEPPGVPGTIEVEGGKMTSTLVLSFAPATHGPASATLTLGDSNALEGDREIVLTGMGRGAEMEVRVDGRRLAHHTTHTVSDIRVDSSTEVRVEVHNRGNVPMNISTPRGNDTGDMTGFVLDETGGLPRVVTDGHSVTFTFEFNPDKRGTAITEITFGSDAAVSGTQTILLKNRAVGPLISTEPDAGAGVQFGRVRANSSTNRKVVITNMGDAPMLVSSVTVVVSSERVSESVLSLVEPKRFPQVVSARETLELTVRFMPDRPDGVIGGDLTIISDAVNVDNPDREPKKLNISGEAVASEITVWINGKLASKPDVMSYNFGDIRVDASSRAEVIIDNRGGSASLEVQSPRLNSPALVSNPHFDMTEKVDFPLVVAKGVSRSSLTLLFDPQERGVQTTTLTFVSDAFNGDSQVITLRGRGVGPKLVVEVDDVVREFGREFRFGERQVNTMTSVRVRIENRGNTVLDITEPVEVEMAEADFQFVDRPQGQVDRLRPRLPERRKPAYSVGVSARTIPVGSSSTFMLRFKPSVPSRQDNGRLVINSNDPDHPRWVLNLKGSGEGGLLRATWYVDGAGHDAYPGGVYNAGDRLVNEDFPTGLRVRLHNLGNGQLNAQAEMSEGSEGFVMHGTHYFQASNIGPSQFDRGHAHYRTLYFSPRRPGVHTGTVIIRSNDSTFPEISVPVTGNGLAPDIDVQAVDFGDVQVRGTSSAEVVVHNRGGAVLRITNAVRGPNSQFSDDIARFLPIPVQPGEASTLSVSFSPTVQGVSSTTLTFISNSHRERSHAVTLKGRGIGKPRIEVAINGAVRQHEGIPHQFASQRVGTTASVEVRISNLGNVPLVITTPVRVETTAADFQFLDRDLTPTRKLRPTVDERHTPPYFVGESAPTIAAGSSSTFKLRFAPGVPSREDNGRLVINSNDPDRPEWALKLKGSGRGALMRVTLVADGVVYIHPTQTHVHDAGEVRVNQRSDENDLFLRFQNLGNENLNVSLKMAAGSEGFRIDYWSRRHILGENQVRLPRIIFEPRRAGTHTATVLVDSNDPALRKFRIQLIGKGVRPWLRVSFSGCAAGSSNVAREISHGVVNCVFGNVLLGESKTVTATLTNTGNGQLVIDNIALTENTSSFFVLDGPRSKTINPGDSHPWGVKFTPVAGRKGLYEGWLRFRGSHDNPLPRFDFEARSVEPAMFVEVNRQTKNTGGKHNFGERRVNTTGSVMVTIRNRGDGTLKITEPIRVETTATDFQFLERDPTPTRKLRPTVDERHTPPYIVGESTRTIVPWGSSTFMVHFKPGVPSRKDNGRLVINTNDPNLPEWKLNLEGKGKGALMRVTLITNDAAYPHPTQTHVHDVGSVLVNRRLPGNLYVRLQNLGNENLSASLRMAAGSEGFRINNWDRNLTLEENQVRPSWITFEPTRPGTHTGTVVIDSNDAALRQFRIQLKGNGLGPVMEVRVDDVVYRHGGEFGFGQTLMNSMTSVVVRVRNAGDGDLRITSIGTTNTKLEFLDRRQAWVDQLRPTLEERRKEAYHVSDGRARTITADSSSTFILNFRPNVPSSADRALLMISSNDPNHPDWRLNLTGKGSGRLLRVNLFDMNPGIKLPEEAYSRADEGFIAYHVRDARFEGHSVFRSVRTLRAFVRISSMGDISMSLPTFKPAGHSGGFFWGAGQWNQQNGPDGTWSYLRNIHFSPVHAGVNTGTLIISSEDDAIPEIRIRLTGNGTPVQSWAGGAQRPAIPTFTALGPADISAPHFVGLGYSDWQSRLWLAFDEPAQVLSGTGARLLADGAALSGFEVLPNYTGGDGVEDIGVLRARYRSGGVVMDLARGIGPADASVWARYTPPSDGVSGIYDLAVPPNRISSVRLFMLPRSAVLDYDSDGFPDALEARLGGNPLVADDVAGLPEVALLRAGAAGSPAAVAYSGIRADGVAAHLGVMTTGASSLAAYYLSDTFGYSGGYAPGVGGYGCTGQFPADYALPLFGGGCAVVDFNNIRAGVEHHIGWLATNAAGYWAVAEDTASRLPEMVILRVPEFNMKRRNVFVPNSAAADETVVVGAFHDGPASSKSLIVSLSNVAAADSPSSSQPDGFSVSVADVTTDTTSYAITGVHSGEDSKLWLAGDPLSSLTPDKYSLGKVTQTDVVRLADDNLPPLFGRTSLYVGSTADENERHAVVVRGTENYIALLPVVQGSAQTASAFEVSPWDGAGGGPVAADDRIVAVNEASPVADGALVRIAFTASSPPATVRNTMSLEVAASSAGADTATTVLTWPVIDSADALATITGDNDNDGIPDVRDSYRLLNRLPIAVVGGVSGYPDRSSAGADGWHHIRPLLPLHNQFVGSYATRAGLSFHTGFNGDARILARLPVRTSGGEAITAPEGQSVLAATYQPGVAIQMNYADFAASLSRDEFVSMAQQSRQDIAVVYNFRLHGVEPSVAQDAALVGGRAGVVIPLPESLRETASILPLHYTNGAWSSFSTEPDAPATAGFAPLQAGVCPDDSGAAGSAYRTESGALNTRKRTGDACMVLYLTDGATADRDGNLNGVVDALIGLAAIPSKE